MQVDAFLSALQAGTEIHHSIMTKIRSCSSRPTEAVHFFTSMLHPLPHCRPSALTAGSLLYLSETSMQMLDAQEGLGLFKSQPYSVASDAGSNSTSSTSQGYSATSMEGQGLDESQVHSRVPQVFRAAVQAVQSIIRPVIQVHRATPTSIKTISSSEQHGDRLADPASMKALSEQPKMRQLEPLPASHSHDSPSISLAHGSQLSARPCVAASVQGTVQKELPCHAVDLQSDDEFDNSWPFDSCDASMASAVSEHTLACHPISDFDFDQDEDYLPEAAERNSALAADANRCPVVGGNTVSGAPFKQMPADQVVSVSASRLLALPEPADSNIWGKAPPHHAGHALLTELKQVVADPAR